ncbi:MAG: methylated-DNA--[protein]-cysteine S-methyltransferase [Candidatus Nanohaloarchaea archaeon]
MEAKILGAEVRFKESLIDGEEKEIRRQLREYLKGERKIFDLDIEYPDSFTGEVMKAMSRIGYGETMTYGELAKKIDSSPVAIGQGGGRNPVPIIIPCHRIVASDGLGGYQYPELKEKLIDLEN